MTFLSAIQIRDFLPPKKGWGKGQSGRGCKTSDSGSLVTQGGGKASTLSVGGHDGLCYVFLGWDFWCYNHMYIPSLPSTYVWIVWFRVYFFVYVYLFYY